MRTYVRRAIQSYQETAQYERVTTTSSSCAGSGQVLAADNPLSVAPLAGYYRLKGEALPTLVQSAVQPLAADEETQQFLLSCKPNWCMSTLATLLRCFYSITDTNAILRRGQMFVLSKEHVRELLHGVLYPVGREQGNVSAVTEARASSDLRLLDVGAGDGGVTAKLSPFFSDITVTEVSHHMGARLRERGYTVHVTPYLSPEVFPTPQQYDVVSIFNVLDRCDHPTDLLKGAMRLMKPDGRLLLAVVLPFSEFVEDGTRRRAVIQPLPMRGARCGDGASFEASLSALIGRVLIPLGLEIERIAKVPYLSRGDSDRPYYVLSDAIIVCKLLPPGTRPLGPLVSPVETYSQQLMSAGGPLMMHNARTASRGISIPILPPEPVDIEKLA